MFNLPVDSLGLDLLGRASFANYVFFSEMSGLTLFDAIILHLRILHVDKMKSSLDKRQMKYSDNLVSNRHILRNKGWSCKTKSDKRTQKQRKRRRGQTWSSNLETPEVGNYGQCTILIVTQDIWMP